MIIEATVVVVAFKSWLVEIASMINSNDDNNSNNCGVQTI